VIAEGIERRGQLSQLGTLGCKTGQGFLLARPKNLEATERLLEHRAAGSGRTASRPQLAVG